MSFIWKLLSWFLPTTERVEPVQYPRKRIADAQPNPTVPVKVSSGIKLVISTRLNEVKQYDFQDNPSAAYQFGLTMLLSQPLLYASIQGIRTDERGARQEIFAVGQYTNYGTETYDYTPSFNGSWQPPADDRVTHRISMSDAY